MSAKEDKADKADSPSSNGNTSADQPQPECFVIMPISDPDGYEPGHFGKVFDDLFVPACDSVGYRAVRADQVRQTNLIHLDVLQKIVESPMAICDLSSRNPNVLFELGLRQAFDKPTVLVQEKGTPAIFDITPLRYTEYHREMLYRQVIEDQEKLTNAIRATKEAIGNSKSVNSIVKLLSLTNAASLTNISEGDKESALLQIIMSEISNLRTEVSRSQGYANERAGFRMGGKRSDRKDRIMLVGIDLAHIRTEIGRIRAEMESSDNTHQPSSKIFDRITAARTKLAELSDYIFAHDMEDSQTIDDLSVMENQLLELHRSWRVAEHDWLVRERHPHVP